MPHDKRMQFFTNLRNQMARAQQAQQLQQQQQQQMSQGGAWQQAPGLQQAGLGPVRQPGPSHQPAAQVSARALLLSPFFNCLGCHINVLFTLTTLITTLGVLAFIGSCASA